MYKNQKSVRNGIEDFLCPFTDMYITQGSNMKPSHMGIMANDVRGLEPGVRYLIYAPCDMVCVRLYPESGQAMFQSKNKVRFANSRIDYATIMVAHDNTMDCYVGQEFKQGDSFFQMGDKGNATGVHTHIEISQSNDTSWTKNSFEVYHFNNEYDLDDCYFVDNTNIIEGMGGSWKHTTDVPIESNKFINVPEWIEERNIYDSNFIQFATIKPKKFGGLSYKVFSIQGEFAEIETVNFGRCFIKITESTPITETPTYDHGNY